MGMHPLCCMPTKGASAAARQSAATASALFVSTGDGPAEMLWTAWVADLEYMYMIPFDLCLDPEISNYFKKRT